MQKQIEKEVKKLTSGTDQSGYTAAGLYDCACAGVTLHADVELGHDGSLIHDVIVCRCGNTHSAQAALDRAEREASPLRPGWMKD